MQLNICPVCKQKFKARVTVCPLDGAALEVLPDPLLGHVLDGRYKLLERIGEGGMGTVYRARHEAIERDVALKLLHLELTLDPVLRKRFLREARATSRLRHPNIVDITDFGTASGRVFLVMELLEGESLAAAITHNPLPLRQALEILAQTAEALAHAHGEAVVHRDIKPENVFLVRSDEGCRVRVLDFGIARVFGEEPLTITGHVFGTPEYMSPEQSMGEPVSFTADLYSLGVLAYELLTGALPYTGSMVELMARHGRDPIPSPRHANPKVPEALDALVTKLLAKSPKDRPQASAEVARSLREALEQFPDSPNSERPVGQGTRQGIGPSCPGALPLAVWRERWNVLRAALGAAFPGAVDATLAEAMDTLGRRIDLLPALDRAVDALQRDLQARDETHDERRGRLQHALSSLDLETESEKNAHDSAGEDKAVRARRAEADAGALVTGWARIATALPAPDLASTEALVALGRLAGQVRALRGEVQSLEEAHRARAHHLQELSFQRAALKARLEALEAEHKRTTEGMRRRMVDADEEILEQQRAIVSETRWLARSLAAHEAAAPLITWEAL
ncbi:MAG: protein kinase [Deltaproteobacteria bacterium]|nr:protein kinase [Deltaproteobacteria bacterium]